MTRLFISLISIGIIINFYGCAISQSISTSVSQSADSISASVSTALNSISRSVGSISRSLSGGSGQSQLYEKDVETLVSFYATQPEKAVFMEEDIARIANEHGILNWKSYYGTYYSVGKGLKSVGISEKELESLLDTAFSNREELKTIVFNGYHEY